MTGLLVRGVANSVDSLCSAQQLRRMKLAPSPECDDDFETALGFEITLAVYMTYRYHGLNDTLLLRKRHSRLGSINTVR